jgi:hypothetical protein
MDRVEKGALIGGGALVAVLVTAAAISGGAAPPSPPPGGCCPEGQVYTGEQVGTGVNVPGQTYEQMGPVCALAADEPYPCPCECTGTGDCGDYSGPYSDMGPGLNLWGCCPPGSIHFAGQPGCTSTTWTPPEITGCQAQCCPGGGVGPGIVGGSCVFCLNGIGGCACGTACPGVTGMVVSAPGIL